MVYLYYTFLTTADLFNNVFNIDWLDTKIQFSWPPIVWLNKYKKPFNFLRYYELPGNLIFYSEIHLCRDHCDFYYWLFTNLGIINPQTHNTWRIPGFLNYKKTFSNFFFWFLYFIFFFNIFYLYFILIYFF